ncbi:MAG: LPS biosynthesis protein [Gammaproteobacteria bacterium CG11_big_fil_rev_8_21_14_0_20_46_22]|nr:MAG: LPS biosynthesis protein [Gammaproteobacteria bacterium CG12_big_fil_rev_8_21_14_0_65_46_12]PIR12124.1 MAG: LPS biosynthesis protein [Gammaproteobacteria bacterium CG11_big_fil_rev_8_21_14_0_20_46_22]
MKKTDIFFDDQVWQDEWYKLKARVVRVCSRCVYDSLVPGIKFDSKGVCSYCKTHDELMAQYPGGEQGCETFQRLVNRIKHEGRDKPYDVIVGVSGGCDSSYMIHLSKEYGLRPLAVHFDNTWNSTTAVENIYNVLKKHNIDLWTHVVDNEEYDDLYKAILKAGVPDLEAPTDLALAATLNVAAEKYKIQYVFEGHSFKTEGLSPLGRLYMDAKYINDMHQRFGEKRRLETYPYLWLGRQLKWMLLNRLKKIRPLWYLDYNKDAAKAILTENYGWKWYGGHHLENRMTAFYHTYFSPRRFGLDHRVNGFSALVRSGQMAREEALAELDKPPACDRELVDMILKRWRLNEETFAELMVLPKKYYTDYKNYKRMFERMRPFFYLMAKFELVPWSFYLKYTSKS